LDNSLVKQLIGIKVYKFNANVDIYLNGN